MERVVKVFKSHEAEEAADRAYYRSLTPQQRLEIQLELIARYRREHGVGERMERVYRIVNLSDE